MPPSTQVKTPAGDWVVTAATRPAGLGRANIRMLNLVRNATQVGNVSNLRPVRLASEIGQ